MATTVKRIKLSEIAHEAVSNSGPCPELAPEDAPALVIVERVGDRYQIVDGFHRASGMVSWAEEQELDPSDVLIDVVVSDPGPGQEAVIATLYELAKSAVRARRRRELQRSGAVAPPQTQKTPRPHDGTSGW